MPEQRAKSTAQLTTFARAVAFLETDPQLRAPDDLALRFLDSPLAWATRSRLLRRLAIRLYDRKLPGAYLYTIARTKHIDAVLRGELEDGAGQVVVLGAGCDSRAYRFHDGFPAARFFEVDYPATSAAKLRKVTALFGRPPEHVSYLAADLTVETLAAALLRAGHDPAGRTIFIAEGLTMYLTDAGVDDIMACVARHSGRAARSFSTTSFARSSKVTRRCTVQSRRFVSSAGGRSPSSSASRRGESGGTSGSEASSASRSWGPLTSRGPTSGAATEP